MRILIVEDDPGIANGLLTSLRLAGYAADVCDTLAHAWAALRVEPFDAMSRAARGNTRQELPRSDIPVLIMTARDGVDDRIAGLDCGADDYLVKPFDANEMLARIRAMLRRGAGRASPVLQCRDLLIDPAAHTVVRGADKVPLGAREFALLLTLVEARPQVLSKARLEATLYGFGQELDSNAIEVHVHHLRRKLGESLIKTIRGVGYFVPREDGA
jgi:two-component system response regulator QseB